MATSGQSAALSGSPLSSVTPSGNEGPTTRSQKAKNKGKGRARHQSETPKGRAPPQSETPPLWAATLFQQLQEMKESQEQLRDRLQVAEERPLVQDSPPQLSSTRRERFSQTPRLYGSQTDTENDDLPIRATRNSRKKTSKMEDPEPLSNGIRPTFDLWQIGILDKFAINHDHFKDNESKCAYIYNRTSGDAQQHLFPRWKRTSRERYKKPEEMIETLAEIYRDPNEEENA